MKHLSFFTTPINLGSEENIDAFIEFHRNFLVHPTNFRNQDGTFIQDSWLEEPLDSNNIIGQQIKIDANYDDCTVILSGEGGLDFCQIDEVAPEYFATSQVLGNFMETIFNYDFGHFNPDVEIYIESVDPETKLKELETIRLGDYHSAESYAKRHDEIVDDIQSINHQIAQLQKEKEAKCKTVEIYAKRAQGYWDGLPF